MKEMMTKFDAKHDDKDARILKLEAFEKKSEQRFGFIEEDIEKLKKKLQALIDGMGKSDGPVVDTSGIMIQIAAMKEQLSTCATTTDLNELRIELKAYADKGDKTLKEEIEKSLQGIRFEVERH